MTLLIVLVTLEFVLLGFRWEAVVAVVSIFSALGVILTSFILWQIDRPRLKKSENAIGELKKELKETKNEMKENLEKHVREGRHDIELIYQKIDTSNADLREELVKLNHLMLNILITKRGQAEEEKRKNNL